MGAKNCFRKVKICHVGDIRKMCLQCEVPNVIENPNHSFEFDVILYFD